MGADAKPLRIATADIRVERTSEVSLRFGDDLLAFRRQLFYPGRRNRNSVWTLTVLPFISITG